MSESILQVMDVEFANQKINRIPAGYIDKKICGCGLTTIALENEVNTVVAVPRVALIKNKCVQYPNERSSNVIFPVFGGVTRSQIDKYTASAAVIKIMVTFDSLHKVIHLLDRCHLVIDESNMLLSDTKMKPEVVDNVFAIAEMHSGTVSFVSATPTPLKYLPEWVSNIDQVKFVWTNTRKSSPILCKRSYPYRSLKEEFIQPLWEKKEVTVNARTFSKVIVFINNIKQITAIINETGIDKKDCAIFCGDNIKNDTKIAGIKRLETPTKMPMFTFVTSSGFQGVDFYDDDAMTIVVSNTSQSYQMIDMMTDLKQAVSRQRSKNNPNYGSYIYIYNQSIFEKSEVELLQLLNDCREKIEYNIPTYEKYKLDGKEKAFMYDSEFTSYTLFKNGSFILNEQAFNADMYFIMEIRRQYEKGFDIVGLQDECIVCETFEKSTSDPNYISLVKYFKTNQVEGKIDWCEYVDKKEWISIITDCYMYYGKVWENFTIAKEKLENFGDSYELIKQDIRSAFSFGKRYYHIEVKRILNGIYKTYGVNRLPKVTDLNTLVNYSHKTVRGERMIEIIKVI
jgi:hypothetical protein